MKVDPNRHCLKTGTFAKSAQNGTSGAEKKTKTTFQRQYPPKMVTNTFVLCVYHFECPNLRMESKNLAKHPPKWFIRHLVHAFSIFGRVSSQFLKIMFLEAFWRRFTLLKGQKLETGGQARKMPQKSFFLHKWVAYIQDQIILRGKVILTTF